MRERIDQKTVSDSPTSGIKDLGIYANVSITDTGTAMPHLKAGRLKALAINGTRRSSILPQVPTFLESGYKGFEQYGWIGALFPAGVPADRVASMSGAMASVVKSPAMQQRLRELNLARRC